MRIAAIRFKRPACHLFSVCLLLFLLACFSSSALAQSPTARERTQGNRFAPPPSLQDQRALEQDGNAQEIVDADEFAALQSAANSSATTDEEGSVRPGINAFSLLLRGGWVMVPLAIVSLLVLMWTFERFIALRRSRILPRALVRPLTQLIRQSDTLPVQDAYKLCLASPSVASNVIGTALMRTGRPMPEIEKAAFDVMQREIDSATGPVRWLAFLASVAPLLGLLGTVWGLILAFHDTTMLDPTQNRAEALATGIYEALVTTLVGLIIAIPAAAIAQYFENRILRQFRGVEDLTALLLPRLEAYESRLRFDPIGRELVARDIQTAAKVRSSSQPLSANSSQASVNGTMYDIPPIVESNPNVSTSRRSTGSRSDLSKTNRNT